MKLTKHYLVTCLVFLIGCSGDGGGACEESALIGTWNEDGGTDVMAFKASCSGTGSDCDAVFTYPNVTADSGSVLINVSATNGGGGCLPLGETACAYGVAGSALSVDCGLGALNYIKQ